MIAAICLLLPSLIVYTIKDRIERNQEKNSKRVVNCITYMLFTNGLVIFILYVIFDNYGKLISKLNQYNNFACKYFALSLLIVLMIAICDHIVIKRPSIKQKLTIALPYVCLSLLFIVLSVFLDRNVDLILDSDMSSEMILANVLSKEKAILSKEWFYSTELRVLNTQLVFTPLFWLFDDWHTIRIVGSIICWLLLLGSYYYFCRQLGIKKYFAVSAIWLILPFSYIYFSYVITGLYYIPHIVITFLTFGLIFQYVKCDKKYSEILLLVLCLLAVGAGMGGPRQLLVLYIPLVMTDIILYVSVKMAKVRPESLKIKKFLIASIAGSLFSIVGYLINSDILSEIYSYKDWEKIKYQDISLESFMKVVNGILSFLGYQTKEVFSITTVSNLFCCFLLVLLVVIICSGIKKSYSSDEYYICSIYFVVSIVVFTLLYSITSMSYSNRYNVPVMIFALPLTVLGLKEARWPESYKRTIGMVFLIGTIICCGNNYLSYLNGDAYSNSHNGSEYSTITDFLLEEEYLEGYASFWNGNILTELSDGNIDVRVWADSSASTVDQIYKWLQLKSHVDTVPEGSVFVLLRSDQLEKINFYSSLNEANIIYKSDNYIIYGYETYEYLIDDIEEDSNVE